MKNENQCTACGEVLSNNDHATRHASECVVMNSGKTKYYAVGNNPVGKPKQRSLMNWLPTILVFLVVFVPAYLMWRDYKNTWKNKK